MKVISQGGLSDHMFRTDESGNVYISHVHINTTLDTSGKYAKTGSTVHIEGNSESDILIW